MLLRALLLLLVQHSATDVVVVEADGETNQPVSPTALCAIGDLHGDMQHAMRALRLCEAVDEDGSWSGGRMIVVQVGDVLDRGNSSVALLERLWSLRVEAAKAGGELVLLLGNHELLNLQGRTRYVHQAELAAFGGSASWMAAFNPRDGAYGTRLTSQDGFAVRGEAGCRTLFMHAGLRAALAARYGSIDALNAALRSQLVQVRPHSHYS